MSSGGLPALRMTSVNTASVVCFDPCIVPECFQTSPASCLGAHPGTCRSPLSQCQFSWMFTDEVGATLRQWKSTTSSFFSALNEIFLYDDVTRLK